jgi:3-hydroxybutyryl-CoA dehydrogenase
MLATRGAEVRLYARSAATRDAGVAFAKEQLPAVLAKLPGSKAGAIVGVDDVATALKDAWIVFESVPEDLGLKKDIFKQVAALSDADAILASNSSSYSSSAFADGVKNPARLLNTHFLMPPEIIPVELMSCGVHHHWREALSAQGRSGLPGSGWLLLHNRSGEAND